MKLLLSVVFILFSVMFVTLLERKILGYSQIRLGPTKVYFMGLVQPVLDGFKLILKYLVVLYVSSKAVFLLAPVVLMCIMFLIWTVIPELFFGFSMSFMVVLLMCYIGLSVYSSLLSGWSSNSKYSMIGTVRSMAQTVSFEISLSILFFILILKICAFDMSNFSTLFCLALIYLNLIVLSLVFLSCVSECNRAPFDFSEGESELVSGFNTEYSSVEFAFLFIGEYGMLLFFSMLCCLLFMFSFNILFVALFVSAFLLLRSCFPRFRYDKFMLMCWLKFLPVSIVLLVYFFLVS